MIGSPEQNGIKERFYGSLKDDEVWPKEYDTRAEAIDQIDAWIGFYRTERPHQALGYLTPAESAPRRSAQPVHETQPEVSTPGGTTTLPLRALSPSHRLRLGSPLLVYVGFAPGF